MATTTPEQAKPASATPTATVNPPTLAEQVSSQYANLLYAVNEGNKQRLTRREQFAMAFGAAILSQIRGRSATTLAKETVNFVDEFLLELDRPKGA